MTRQILFCILGFFSILRLTGQEFDASISSYQMTIDGNAQSGYITAFDFGEKQVQRGWWEYSRSFGIPLNMRSYYQVTIPGDAAAGKPEIVLFSKIIDNKKSCKFYLALSEKDVPTELVKSYEAQVKSILADFKKTFYINDLKENIVKTEKKAKRTSKRLAKASGNSRNKLLEDLEALDEIIAAAKARIKQIDRSL